MNEEIKRSIDEFDELNEQLRLLISARRFPRLIIDLFKGSLDPVLVFDFVGKFDVVSPKFAKMLGYKPSDMSGKEIAYFVHPEDIEPTVEAIGYNRKGIEPGYFANRYRHKDGQWVWVLWYPQGEAEDTRHGVCYCAEIKNPPEWIQAGFIDVIVRREMDFGENPD